MNAKKETFFAAALALALPLAQAGAAPGKIKFDLYVMSICPYGITAENGAFPAIKSLAEYVDFNLLFIGGQAPGPDGMPTFTALHGEPETQENIRQVCAMKLTPDKYMDYILARNKAGVRSPDWKGAATAAGLDAAKIAKIEECAKGPQGAAWYSKSIEASTARGANSSPTIDIAGKPFTGGRSEAAVSVAICDAIAAGGTPPPAVCATARLAAAKEPAASAGSGCEPAAAGGGQPADTAPKPAVFDITVVTEESCKACAPTLLDNMAGLHPAAKLRTVDASSKDGKDLIKLHRAKTLPLYVLESKVEQDPNFTRLLPVAYYKSHDSYLIRQGPTNYFPSVQLNRPRVPRRLDVFLESHSLASVQAEADLIQFLTQEANALKDLTISFHFLVSEAIEDAAATAPGGGGSVRVATLADLSGGAEGALVSARGEGEIEENVRQLCLFQHHSIGPLFTYLTCRNRSLSDLDSAQRCLTPGKEVKRCMETQEGKNLLRQDARLSKELGLSRAPVFLWENRYGPFGFNETDWRSMLRGTPATVALKPK